MIDFNGKVVLVTGGGAGIGRATVSAFADLGAKVITLEIDEGHADALRAQATDNVDVIRGDATSADDVSALADTINDRYGRLDVLVNNVGHFMTRPTPFEKLTDDQIEGIYRINLKHIFGVTRTMLPLLRAADDGASITNVSWIEGFRGIPQFAVYGAFKAAVTGFTMSLALETPAGEHPGQRGGTGDHRQCPGAARSHDPRFAATPHPAMDSAGPLRDT